MAVVLKSFGPTLEVRPPLVQILVDHVGDAGVGGVVDTVLDPVVYPPHSIAVAAPAVNVAPDIAQVRALADAVHIAG